MSMSSKTLNYIKKYQINYKKVISKARKRENDKIILRSENPYKGVMANSKKGIWDLKKKQIKTSL
jgi:hypothetical protein